MAEETVTSQPCTKRFLVCAAWRERSLTQSAAWNTVQQARRENVHTGSHVPKNCVLHLPDLPLVESLCVQVGRKKPARVKRWQTWTAHSESLTQKGHTTWHVAARTVTRHNKLSHSYSLSHSLTLSLSHSLTLSLSHSLTLSLTHSLTLSLSYSLTLLLSHSLTLSLSFSLSLFLC